VGTGSGTGAGTGTGRGTGTGAGTGTCTGMVTGIITGAVTGTGTVRYAPANDKRHTKHCRGRNWIFERRGCHCSNLFDEYGRTVNPKWRARRIQRIVLTQGHGQGFRSVLDCAPFGNHSGASKRRACCAPAVLALIWAPTTPSQLQMHKFHA
jgi:hypothetical protein